MRARTRRHLLSFNERRPLKLKANAISDAARWNETSDSDNSCSDGNDIRASPEASFNTSQAKKFRGSSRSKPELRRKQPSTKAQSPRSSSSDCRCCEFNISAPWRDKKSFSDCIPLQDKDRRAVNLARLSANWLRRLSRHSLSVMSDSDLSWLCFIDKCPEVPSNSAGTQIPMDQLYWLSLLS